LAGIVPLATMIVALASDSYDKKAGLGVGLLGRPAIAFAGFTLLLLALAVRSRRKEPLALSAAYAFLTVVLFRPLLDGGIERIDWELVRIGIVIAAAPMLF